MNSLQKCLNFKKTLTLFYSIFRLTIASEDDVYWERWRPISGFLQPISQKDKPSKVVKEVFADEKGAFEQYWNARTPKY